SPQQCERQGPGRETTKVVRLPSKWLIATVQSATASSRISFRGEKSMKFLHTMIRVNNLDESIRFYCDVLGMKLLRRKDYPSGKFTLAFVGYGDESANTVVELTHNWDTHKYDIGNGFGHLALGVDDIYQTCDDLRSRGAK